MIELINIPSEDAPYFEECWQLYEESFPPEERRERWYHVKSLESEIFHFDAIIDNGALVGLIGWWDFDDERYIEHIAISPKLRNGGYGKAILSLLKSLSSKPIILEVEHPEDDLSTRRIEFYRREGFVLNMHHYIHPPYRGDEWVSLLIMSYPNAISLDHLEQFKDKYFPLIHFRGVQIPPPF